MISLKTDFEIGQMRETGRVLAMVLGHLQRIVQPGMSTREVDIEARNLIFAHGAEPAFEGFRGYPATSCVSVNEEVSHGIPSRRLLQAGDIVSVDVGVCRNGFCADAAITLALGDVSTVARRLIEVTEVALATGIAQARPGNRIRDISAAIQSTVESCGFAVVRQCTGHGIGRTLHEDPKVPNFGRRGTGMLLQEGMTLAIEPVVAEGAGNVRVKSDGWTMVTEDGGLSAHFEHTVAVTSEGPLVLSAL